MRLRMQWVLGAVVLVAAACGGGRAPLPTGSEQAQVTLSIDQRSSRAPSVAAWGRMVAVAWSASNEAQSDIYISVSNDSGTTFAAPVRVNNVDGDARASGEQAPRVAAGPGNVVHVAWPARHGDRSVIRYASSADGGKSFSKATTIAGDDVSGLRGWQAMTLGYDGVVHAAWLDGRNAPPSTGHRGGHVQHGSGAAASTPTHPKTAPRQDIFYASWKGDGPRTERLLTANVCFCCKTAIATAGDRVYVAWRHIYPGSVRDIALARSVDNGATFGPPMRVSEDNWTIPGCPDDGPAMAADGHGGIHVVWPTLVAGDAPRKGIFYASYVEGQGFTPRQRLDSGDTETAHPQIVANEHETSAVVWDERAANGRRIVLRQVTHEKASAAVIFDAGGATYPTVAAAEGHWIVVWTAQRDDGRSVIETRRVPMNP